jgi:hypothetical protein
MTMEMRIPKIRRKNMKSGSARMVLKSIVTLIIPRVVIALI